MTERGAIKLIIDRCNAHDVPDAADLIERLAGELAEAKKQIVMLRSVVAHILRCIPPNGFVQIHYESATAADLDAALYATEELSGLILCDAEPVAWMRDAGEPSLSTMSHCIPTTVKDIWLKVNPKNVERYTVPLYQARSAK